MRTRDEQKEKLVKKKAIKMLVENGLEGFSMQKLANACKISVATLYIYYKDKGDLITQIGIEEAKKMTEYTLRNFSPDLSFSEGLKIQWKNRSEFALNHQVSMKCTEVLSHSPYGDIIQKMFVEDFRPVMEKFVRKAIAEKQLKRMPLEVYWCIAFGPLYSLIQMHFKKKSIGNKPFKFTDELMYETLELVLKALKP